MKIEIAINDSAGFINEQYQSVVGGEIIYLAFKTSDCDMEVIRLAFLVNSILARKRTDIDRTVYYRRLFDRTLCLLIRRYLELTDIA